MIKYNKAQCKVVLYKWTQRELDTEDAVPFSELAATESIGLSEYVVSVEYNKNRAQAAGAFVIRLGNAAIQKAGKPTQNLLEYIPRGCWCVVLMSQKGDLKMDNAINATEHQYIRFVGYINRVNAISHLNESGAFDATIEITGRDHGCIYEKTDVWLDITVAENLTKVWLKQYELPNKDRRLDQFIKKFHDIVYHPKLEPSIEKVLNKKEKESLFSTGNQWILPTKLVSDLKIKLRNPGDGSRWGNLDIIKNIKTLFWYFGKSAAEAYSSGNMWTKLKSLSCPMFNELYTEIDGGIPKLIYRPIPFAINKSQYDMLRGAFPYYVDLAKDPNSNVLVYRHDILAFNVGYDDESLGNSFKIEIKADLIGAKQLTAYYTSAVRNTYNFPRHYRNSIVRHGLRRIHPTLQKIAIRLIGDFLKEKDTDPNLDLTKELHKESKVLNSYLNSIKDIATVKIDKVEESINVIFKVPNTLIANATKFGAKSAGEQMPVLYKAQKKLENERLKAKKAIQDQVQTQLDKINKIKKSMKNRIDSANKINAPMDLRYLANMNNVAADFWQYNVLSKSGTFSLIGRNDLRLGKVMTFDPKMNQPYINSNDIYYIEGYSDTFNVNGLGVSTWIQKAIVTRGFNQNVLNEVKKDNLNNKEASPNMRRKGLSNSTQKDVNYGRFDPVPKKEEE